MDFSAIKNYLDNVDGNLVPFRECLVTVNGKEVFRHSCCQAEAAEQERGKDTYYIFSKRKISTCVAAMRLVEEGKMSLDDPVSKYLPEFDELYIGGSYARCAEVRDDDMPKAKNPLLIKNLFAMGGGLTYNLGHPEIRKVREATDDKADTRQIASAIAKMPLLFEPGEDYSYSLCHDVLGAVIEVVSGKSLFNYFNEIIFAPLGMKDTVFHPDKEYLDRMHAQYMVYPQKQVAVLRETGCVYALSDNYLSGGAGLASTLEDYSKLLTCLACGESESGYRILKPETVALMHTPQLCEKAQKTFSANPNLMGYSYGLGVRTHVDGSVSNSLSPVGEFGWDGAAGAFGMVDTVNKVSITYMQ
ncbi:MAG: beta-lactamase family protein, partial [Clostridia bacterium]|nr:beta-lactamase family protein [Clostridia bacterium]